MEYYQSALEAVAGNAPENTVDVGSPSKAFEEDYVPFSMAPEAYGLGSSDLYPAQSSHFETVTGDSLSPYDARSVAHSAGTGQDYTINGESSDNCRFPSTGNHDDYATPVQITGTPRHSPVDDVVVPVQQFPPNFLPPLESRRPGRPRGGRLPEIEQYYRAVAQLNHSQTRSIPGIPVPNVAFDPHLSAATFGQGGDQVFGQAAGGLGYDMGSQAYRGPASGGAGHEAEDTADLARSQPHLGLGSQAQPGSGGGFAGFSSTAGGDHPTQSAQAPPCQYANDTNNNIETDNTQFNAPTQFSGPCGNKDINNNNSTAHLGGPTQSSGPLQFPAASQLTGLPSLHPGRQSTQSSAPYEQPQQRVTAPGPQPTIFPPIAAFHDLPASVTERPTFQRMLKQATDPEHLPPNLTAEQVRTIQHSRIHAAKAKFDKVRAANNRSAKRGRFRRMAITVGLADEVMRQKAEVARLEQHNEKMQSELERVEVLVPGLTTTNEAVQAQQSTGLQQHGDGYGTMTTSSFFDQQSSNDCHATGSASYEPGSNALNIMLPPLTDLFGSPLSQQPKTGEASSSQANPSTATQTTAAQSFALALPTSSSPAAQQPSAPAPAIPPLDRSFLREAHDMRLQLIDAVRGNKLRALEFSCHEEIDAVVQRGRSIRALLGMADDDWDKWVAAPTTAGRRKRAVSEVEEEEEEMEGAGKKKGKKVAGRR